MKTIETAAIAAIAVAAGLAAMPASARGLRVSVDTFKDGEMIPNKYAFCMPAAQGHTAPGANFSPSISWSPGPRGTKSYAIVLYDTDLPAEQREKMNKDGITMTSAIPRKTFFHWVLVDIPLRIRSLEEGAESGRARGSRQAGDARRSRRSRAQRLHQGHRQQRCHEGAILRL